MLGLFDSGSGGLGTVRYVKQLSPSTDLIYKIDRQNAPYGTKNKKDLIRIIENNLDELSLRGAQKILIACCTASALYDELSERHKAISIPIIYPIAISARAVSQNGRIGVIATLGTVKSHAFARALHDLAVFERPAQELVGLIDGGLSDATASSEDKDMLRRIVLPLARKNIDTLILGCTHFPSLYQSFEDVCYPLGIKNIVNSVKIGAIALLSKEQDERKQKWQNTEEEE